MSNSFRLIHDLNPFEREHADKLRVALLNRSWLWDVDKRRESYPGSAHAQAQSIILRYCVVKGAEATLAEILDEIECVDYPLLAELPEAAVMLVRVRGILEEQGLGSRIGRALITRLQPEAGIYSHVDEGKAAEVYTRYHIPLSTSRFARFYCGDHSQVMREGEMWWFNHRLKHSVTNFGPSDRIHLIVDAM